MAIYNGNSQYLSINGTVMGDPSDSAEKIFRSFEMNLSTGDEDVSGGAGSAWEDHAGKLSVINGTIEINYDTARIGTDVVAICNNLGYGDVIPIVSGPEGNTTGQPKHDQDFLVTGVDGPNTNHDKTRVALSITVISSGPPRSNVYAGDTF